MRNNMELGTARLRAIRHGDAWAYYADETSTWYAVSAAEIEELGEMLADGVDDAYSHWCAGTPACDLATVLCGEYSAVHPGRATSSTLRTIVEHAQRDDGPDVTVADIHAIVLAAEEEVAS